MKSKIQKIILLVIMSFVCVNVVAQKVLPKKEQKSTQAINTESDSLQAVPYVMTVKIKKLANNKKVVSSVVVKENKSVLQKAQRNYVNNNSKDKVLRLRKRRRKTHKVAIK
ncbi:MAG: hypothetical protein MK202_01455 [Tenacibaculum sp.]|nr:hypothetical protein [Tenacibaculum sp.]